MDNIQLVERNLLTLQFISGIRVYKNTLWAISSRFQLALTKQINPQETNFRILAGYIPYILDKENEYDENIFIIRQD